MSVARRLLEGRWGAAGRPVKRQKIIVVRRDGGLGLGGANGLLRAGLCAVSKERKQGASKPPHEWLCRS